MVSFLFVLKDYGFCFFFSDILVLSLMLVKLLFVLFVFFLWILGILLVWLSLFLLICLDYLFEFNNLYNFLGIYFM